MPKSMLSAGEVGMRWSFWVRSSWEPSPLCFSRQRCRGGAGAGTEAASGGEIPESPVRGDRCPLRCSGEWGPGHAASLWFLCLGEEDSGNVALNFARPPSPCCDWGVCPVCITVVPGYSCTNGASVSVLQATLLQSKLNQIFEITIR